MNRKAANYLDTKCIAHWLSLATNLLTLGTTVGIVVGFFLVWNYLDGFGLGYEVIGILGTPHYLLIAALIALAITIWLVGFSIVTPSLLRSWVSSNYHKIHKPTTITWVAYAAVCSLVGFFYFAIIHVFTIGFLQGLCLVVLFMLQTIILSLLHEGPADMDLMKKGAIKAWFDYISLTLFMLALLFMLLSYGFLFMVKIVDRFSEEGFLGWLLIAIGYFVYCVSVTSTVYRKEGFLGYLPVIAIAAIFISTFFSNAINNIMSFIRLGGYSYSLVVSEKILEEKDITSNFDITMVDDKVHIKGAWVIASLPERIIIAPGRGDRQLLSIPKGDVFPTIFWLE